MMFSKIRLHFDLISSMFLFLLMGYLDETILLYPLGIQED